MSSIDRIGQIDTMVDKGITQTDINDYYDKSMGRGKYDIFGGGSTGDGAQSFIPIDYNTGAASVEAVEPYTNDFTYRGDGIQRVGADVTRGYAADGGIMGTRARRAFGGIMDRVDKRKGFFLGGIGKAIGKVVGGVAKAAGKVLSSDAGKLALAGAAFYYGGGGRMPFTEAFKAKGFGGAKLFGQGSFLSKSNPLFTAPLSATSLYHLVKFGNFLRPISCHSCLAIQGKVAISAIE